MTPPDRSWGLRADTSLGVCLPRISWRECKGLGWPSSGQRLLVQDRVQDFVQSRWVEI